MAHVVGGAELDSLIIDSIASPVVVLDRHGIVVRFNRAGARACGCAPADVVGRPFWETFVPPGEADAHRTAFDQLFGDATPSPDAPLEFETDWVTRDGRRRVAWSLACVPAGPDCVSPRLVVATGTDLTERRRAEAAVRQERERLQAQYQAFPVPTYTWQRRGETDLVLIAYNDAARAFTRGRVAAYLGRSAADVYSDQPVVLADMTRCVEYRCVVRREMDYRLLSTGQLRRMSITYVSVPPDVVTAHAEDVTERRLAEEALARSEARFRRVGESNIIGLMFFDLDGRITWANDAFLAIVGYTRDDLHQGRVSWSAMTPPEYADRDARGVEELLLHGTCQPFEKEYVRKDGARVPIVIAAAFLEGSRHEGVSFVPDISARKRAERELVALNETLERRVAERTAELGAANAALRTEVAERTQAAASLRESRRHYQELAERNRRLVRELNHRVRNNLAGLLGLISMMRETAADVPSFADALRGRLSAMAQVHQLLAGGGGRRVDLGALVRSTLDALRQLASHDAVIAVDGPPVALHPDQVLPLTMVLNEWFTNSCKHGAHSTGGGTLDVRWDVAANGDERPPRVRLRWTERGGPPLRGPIVPSLGTKLVNSFARRELRGSCTLAFLEGGADHLLEFPAAAQAADHGASPGGV